MFGGAYYIWFMAAFFLLAVLLIGGFSLILWVGHLIEKKETGARHGFLELPEELRGTRDVKHEEHEAPPRTKEHEGEHDGATKE